MVPGQTSIPVDETVPAVQPCRWCGSPTSLKMTIAKARYRNDRGVRVVAKQAVQWPACKAHMDSVVREDLDA